MPAAREDSHPFQGLKVLWRWIGQLSRPLLQALHRTAPKPAALLDTIDAIIRSPYFAIVLGIFLSVLWLAGVFSMPVVILLALAWLVSLIGLSRSDRVKSLSPKTRLPILLAIAAFLAVVFVTFGKWTLSQYYLRQQQQPAQLSARAPAPSASDIADQEWKRNPPLAQLPSQPQSATHVGSVTARCEVPNDRSACVLRCHVENTTSAPVRDVTVGFASRLPTLTQLAAPPDARVRLEKVEDLPIADPRGSVTADLAFRIHIPLVPPKAKLNFTLWTDDENNKRACQQLARIYEMRRAVLSDFFRSILKAGSAKPKEIPNLDVLFAAIAKSEALFQPDAMSSERGRRAVLFISEAESRSLELLGAAYRSFKRRFIEVFKNRGECMAPVFTVEQTGGRSATFAVFPPDIRTYITGAVRLPAVEETAEVAVRPVPPKNYACSP